MSSLGSRQKAASTQAERHPGGPLEPETPMTDRNDRVREIAYFLWLDEGCPEGEAERHWAMAETLLESEPLERKRMEGEPPGEPADDASAVRGVPGAGRK